MLQHVKVLNVYLQVRVYRDFLLEVVTWKCIAKGSVNLAWEKTHNQLRNVTAAPVGVRLSNV